MVDRLIWMMIVIGASLIASLIGAWLRMTFWPPKKAPAKKRRPRDTDDEDETDDVEQVDDDDDDDDDERRRPSRSARKPAAGTNTTALWILGGLGCGSLAMMAMCILIIALTQIFQDDPPPVVNGPPPPVPKIEIPIEPVAEDLGPKARRTDILGGAFNPTFKDEAPAGGFLIGYDIGLGKFANIDLVKAIQPIYQTPNGEVRGRQFGVEFNPRITVKAKPGYAVGAMNVKAGLLVNGFSTTFMRVKGVGLDPADAYTSPWIGDMTGGNGPTLLAGDGTAIVGIIGKHNSRECSGLGLLKR